MILFLFALSLPLITWGAVCAYRASPKYRWRHRRRLCAGCGRPRPSSTRCPKCGDFHVKYVRPWLLKRCAVGVAALLIGTGTFLVAFYHAVPAAFVFWNSAEDGVIDFLKTADSVPPVNEIPVSNSGDSSDAGGGEE